MNTTKELFLTFFLREKKGFGLVKSNYSIPIRFNRAPLRDNYFPSFSFPSPFTIAKTFSDYTSELILNKSIMGRRINSKLDRYTSLIDNQS